MTTLHRMISSMATVLLLVGITTSAHGLVGAGGAPGVGVGNSGRMVHIGGTVLCTECSLEDVRQAHPGEHHLYQLNYTQGHLVLQVHWVNHSNRSIHLASPPHLWVRAADSVLQQLSAEENLFQELELTAMLRSTRTLDLTTVTVQG